MNRGDFLEASLAWVIGMLFQECMPGRLYHSQFHDGEGKFNYDNFHQFALRCHNTVYKYLRGQNTLDGSCSDMECTLAHKARHVFGWQKETTQ